MNSGEPTLRARALRHLARREHTRHELAKKLAPHAGTPQEIEQVLDDFAQRGWLSEQRAAEQMVHARQGRYGPARIRRDLEAKGMAAEVVEGAIAALKEDESEAARAVWKKKFRAPPGSAAEYAKQMRFLLGRGFSGEAVSRLLRGMARGDFDGE